MDNLSEVKEKKKKALHTNGSFSSASVDGALHFLLQAASKHSASMPGGEIFKCFFQTPFFISLNCQTFFPLKWLGNNHISAQWVQSGTSELSVMVNNQSRQRTCRISMPFWKATTQ